jgi:hypothetical protein
LHNSLLPELPLEGEEIDGLSLLPSSPEQALNVNVIANIMIAVRTMGVFNTPLRFATVFLTVMMDSYWWIGEIQI